jgi:hypothetical protein
MERKRNRLSTEKVRNLLKEKTVVFSFWGCESEETWTHQWYLNLKKRFKEVILFDPRKKRLEYGPGLMKAKLLSLIKAKKPDFFFFLTESTDLNVDTIREINKISPNTKTVIHFGDDDVHFHDRSRYYALFVDYGLIFQTNYLEQCLKDGIDERKLFKVAGSNIEASDKKLEKIYDVSFIGGPLPSRIEALKFLKKSGVKVSLFGRGWEDYEEFKDIYKGPLDSKDFVRVMKQSKISLGFSKNKYDKLHLNGRIFESAGLNSFQLVDYFPEYNQYFKENKELVMFKDHKELLKKVKYFLKEEGERERIARNAFKKVVGFLVE